MPRAIVDPAELRAFAARLEGTVNQITDSKKSIASKFAELHGHWKDHKHDSFERVFEEMMTRLDAYSHASAKYVRFLRLKASLGDEYSQTRY